jgi:hypothetical protein
MVVTFKKIDVCEGLHQWDIFLDGELVGEMEKERPSKWHGNGVGGLVQDRRAPWMWDAEVAMPGAKPVRVDIPDGSTAWEARRLIKAAIA